METDLVVAAGNDVHKRRVLGNISDCLLPSGLAGASFSGNQDIQIAHSLAAATKGSSGRDLVNSRELFHVGRNLLTLDFGVIKQEPSSNTTEVLDGLEQLGLVLLAHPGKNSDLS